MNNWRDTAKFYYFVAVPINLCNFISDNIYSLLARSSAGVQIPAIQQQQRLYHRYNCRTDLGWGSICVLLDI